MIYLESVLPYSGLWCPEDLLDERHAAMLLKLQVGCDGVLRGQVQ